MAVHLWIGMNTFSITCSRGIVLEKRGQINLQKNLDGDTGFGFWYKTVVQALTRLPDL